MFRKSFTSNRNSSQKRGESYMKFSKYLVIFAMILICANFGFAKKLSDAPSGSGISTIVRADAVTLSAKTSDTATQITVSSTPVYSVSGIFTNATGLGKNYGAAATFTREAALSDSATQVTVTWLPLNSVTGVYTNSGGLGFNFYSGPGNGFVGGTGVITLNSSTTLGAATSCWVTYNGGAASSFVPATGVITLNGNALPGATTPVWVTYTYQIAGVGDYGSLYEAALDLNTTNITGPWEIQIATDLVEATGIPFATSKSYPTIAAGTTILIRPAAGVKPTIMFSKVPDNTGFSGDLIIGSLPAGITTAITYANMNPVHNLTIDGSNNGTDSQDMYIVNTTTSSTYDRMINVNGACTTIVFKNLIIKNQNLYSGAYSICLRAQGFTVATTLAPSDITIQNCKIFNTYAGGGNSMCIGCTNSGILSSNWAVNNLNIIGNTLVSPNRPTFLNGSANTNLIGNRIRFLQGSTGYDCFGLWHYGAGGATGWTCNIIGNTIDFGFHPTYQTGYGLHAVSAGCEGGTYNIFNNNIAGFNYAQMTTFASNPMMHGIDCGGVTSVYNVSHNSINIASFPNFTASDAAGCVGIDLSGSTLTVATTRQAATSDSATQITISGVTIYSVTGVWTNATGLGVNFAASSAYSLFPTTADSGTQVTAPMYPLTALSGIFTNATGLGHNFAASAAYTKESTVSASATTVDVSAAPISWTPLNAVTGVWTNPTLGFNFYSGPGNSFNNNGLITLNSVTTLSGAGVPVWVSYTGGTVASYVPGTGVITLNANTIPGGAGAAVRVSFTGGTAAYFVPTTGVVTLQGAPLSGGSVPVWVSYSFCSGNQNVTCKNNVIRVAQAGGACIRKTVGGAGGTKDIDYNVLYASGNAIIGTWRNINTYITTVISATTLTQWQLLSGSDVNSQNIDPLATTPGKWLSTLDLRFSDSTASIVMVPALAAVTTDIDGLTRGVTNVWPGCNELSGLAAGTYTWNVVNGDFRTAANWNPNRTSPTGGDTLVFSGGTAYNIPCVNFGKLQVTGTAKSVFDNDKSFGGLVLAGPNALKIDAGSELQINGKSDFLIMLPTNSVGTIDGDLTFSTQAWAVAHRLYARDSGTFIVNNGGTFQQAPNYAGLGNAFGYWDNKEIVFKSGSKFYQGGTKTVGTGDSGSNPFNVATPGACCVFEPGSEYYVWQGSPSFSGRSYGNVTFNWSTGYQPAVSGSGYFVAGNILVKGTSGEIGWGMTGAATTGSVTVEVGGALKDTGASGNWFITGDINAAGRFGPLGSGTRNYIMAGSSAQNITLAQVSVMNALTINNANGVTLGSNLITPSLTLTSGNIDAGANTLFVGTSPTTLGTITRTSGTIIGNLAKWIPVTVSTTTTVFPVGSAAAYTPVTLVVNSITTTAGNNYSAIAVKATDAKHPSAPTAYFASRYFTITPGSGITTINADIGLSYTAADSTDATLTGPGTAINVAKWDGATWSFITTPFVVSSYDAVNSLYTATALGQTSLSDWTISGPLGTPVELSRFEIEAILEK